VTAPAVPVSDAALLATALRVRCNLRAALAAGTEPDRRGAELALWATGEVIRQITGERAITGGAWHEPRSRV
jgi:hypothetical protein